MRVVWRILGAAERRVQSPHDLQVRNIIPPIS